MNTPFTSATFSSVWQKHFSRERSLTTEQLFSGLLFVKQRGLPLYTNMGSTQTKGIFYELREVEPVDFSNKVFRIFDVPSYFQVNTKTQNLNRLGLYKVKQYPGFLIDLTGYNDLNAYMQASFSKSSRYKLNKYKKRLEQAFDVRYEMYFGNLEKELYDTIFTRFKELLEKRFDEKQERNNNLDPDEWAFYYEVAYPMILEKKAGLFVVYQGDTPVAITLNYLSDIVLFDAITVFDIDYSKFHLGSVSVMGLIEWCLENSITTLDFSKGYFEYKKRWASRQYDFEYHIYFDKGSAGSRLLAFALKQFYRFKDYLRRNQVNLLFHKIAYRVQKAKIPQAALPKFEFSKTESNYPEERLKYIDLSLPENAFLKPVLFEYLYLYTAHIDEVQLFKILDEPNACLISGPMESVIAKVDGSKIKVQCLF